MADSGSSPPGTLAPRLGSEARRAAVFLCVGFAGLAVDAILFSGLAGAGLSRAVARALSILTATGVTYALNRSVTFAVRSRAGGGEFGRYALVTLVAQNVSYAIFLGLSATVPRLPALGTLIVGSAAATVFSFAGQRLFTFRGA